MMIPSVLEYARHHGLSRGHTANALSRSIKLLSRASIEDSTLSDVELPSQLSEPTLRVDVRTIRVLERALNIPQLTAWEDVVTRSLSVRHLRLEPSLLVSDHDKDVKWFTRAQDVDGLIMELRQEYDLSELVSTDNTFFLDQCAEATDSFNVGIHNLQLPVPDATMRIVLRSTDTTVAGFDLQSFYRSLPCHRRVSPDSGNEFC
jgi:hypothetical protein